MTLARSLLLALSLPLAVGAQAPTIDSTAVAMRAERLPVVDNGGNVIPEAAIEARIRPGRWRVTKTLLGALAGLIVFVLATDPSAECLSWDPCTPREEWMSDTGPWVGLIVGGLVGAAIPDGRVDRWRAIEIIRAERSAGTQGASR
jgi:hypothetical protein